MNKIFLFFSFFFVFLCKDLSGQISGYLEDQEGLEIAWANVQVLKVEDSSMVAGVQSDEEGRFIFSTSNSDVVFIEVSFIGYSSYSSPPILAKNLDLGRIVLMPSAIDLGALEIIAKRNAIETTAEGTVVNVKGSLMTSGSNVLQVLEKLPGVFLDRQNGDIMLNGSSGVRVLINDKEVNLSSGNLLQYLEGMSGDQVSKVKLLTSPSARYSADGSAGIIVIETEQPSASEPSAFLNTTLGYGSYAKYGLNASVNFNHGNTDWYSNYSFQRDHSYQQWTALGTEEFDPLGGLLSFDVISMTEDVKKSHNLLLGQRTRTKKHGDFGFELSYLNALNNPEVTNNSIYDSQNDWTNAIINNKGDNLWESWIGGIEWTKGQLKIDLSAMEVSNRNLASISNQFLARDGTSIETENEVFVNQLKGDNKSQIRNTSLSADYNIQILHSLNYALGFKTSLTGTKNLTSTKFLNEEAWEEDLRLFNDNGMEERIIALYNSIDYEIDSLTSLSLGLRYELWDRVYRNAGVDDQTRGAFFPTIYVNRKISERRSLGFSYAKRISRPQFNDLATTSSYNGPTAVFSGNPFLKAAISHRLNLSYRHSDFTLSFSGESTEDPIVLYQITENESKNLFILSPQNMIWEKRLNFQLAYNMNKFNWWTGNLSLILSRRYIELDFARQPFAGWYNTYTISGNHNFDLGRGWNLELNGWLNARSYNGTKTLSSFGMLNGGIAKKLRRGKLQFLVTDVLKTMKIGIRYGELTEEAFATRSKVEWAGESAISRIFSLAYSIDLGTKKNHDFSRHKNADRVRIE